MPTPCSRASRTKPSSSSSVAWFGMVGDAAMRTRPSAVPCQRLISRAVRSSRPFVGAGAMSSTVRRRSGGNRSSRPGTVSWKTTSATAGARTTRAPTSPYARATASNVSSVTAGKAMKRSYAAVQPVLSISMAPMAADRYSSSGVRNA